MTCDSNSTIAGHYIKYYLKYILPFSIVNVFKIG